MQEESSSDAIQTIRDGLPARPRVSAQVSEESARKTRFLADKSASTCPGWNGAENLHVENQREDRETIYRANGLLVSTGGARVPGVLLRVAAQSPEAQG